MLKVRIIFIIFLIDFNNYFMNNLNIFDINSSMKRFIDIEIDEINFYFSCKNCKHVPNIFLSDDKNLFIYCKNCGTKSNEKIENIVNFNSDWITNEVIKFCNTKHEEKILSVIYCKTCNLFLCEKCLKEHKQNKKNHVYIKLNKLKINFCNFHNEKLSEFCYDCKEEICKKCLNKHNIHKTEKIEKIYKNKNSENLKNFNIFLEKAENSIKNKYENLKENITYLQNITIKDEESKEQLNKINQNFLDYFYNDLKFVQNLLFLAKILYISSIKIKEFVDNRKEQKEKFLILISKYYDEENFEKFKKFNNKEKGKFLTYLEKFSEKEIENLNLYIDSIFDPKKYQNVSDFDKTKDFIEKNINLSSKLKKFITIEKMNNSDNYINIDKTLNKFENINKEINSFESDYVLSLVGKYLEKNGTELNISKTKNEKLHKIELLSLQYLFTLGIKKKFELHFDFGEEQNKRIFLDPFEKEKILKEYKKKISQKLQINEENLIVTNVHHGCVGIDVAKVNDNMNEKDLIKLLEQMEHIKKVEEKPIIESLQISKDVLDPTGDRNKGWGIGESRGGEKYFPPLGWYGIGLRVLNQYDDGNNDWLDYDNNENEFSIAYLGLNNFLNKKEKIIEDLNKLSKDINKMVKKELFQNEIDLRKKGNICGDGICLFQNPVYAENSAGIIDINGFRMKIILMCRVNPKKIRQPKNYPCWILNPTPDEIRPYRILIKKIPISPMAVGANESIITSPSPIDYIISSIKSNDFSFYDLKQQKQYKTYSTINNQNIENNDFFVINLYSSANYIYINDYLRNKKIDKFTEQQIKSWTCCLQLALKRNKGVKDNTIVYRGINKFKFAPEIGIGSQFYFREFFSTSLDENVAKMFAGCTSDGDNKGTIMVITIKNNGTNGHPNYCYDITDLSKYRDEKEILLSSHCYFLVTNIIRNNLDYVYLTCQGYLLD